MTTNAYAAKREIIDRLAAAAALTGTALNKNNVTVQYAFDAVTATEVMVYGGPVTFDQPGDNDAVDGERRRITAETAQVALIIRVQRTPDPGNLDQIRDTDLIAEEIGEWLGDLLVREPRLAGGSSISRIRSGQGDYAPTEQKAESRLVYIVEVESYITQPSI